MPKYCEDVTRAVRRPTRTVQVGKCSIGSQHPVAKQTMTTTVTRDVNASVDQVLIYHDTFSESLLYSKRALISFCFYYSQVLKIAKEGADLVRLTVQGKFEADACKAIRESLWEKGSDMPLVADIHFSPAVAMRVADAFEKVRVNPGNFADGIKSFENKVYNTRVSIGSCVLFI